MKAIVCTKYGPPEVLKLIEVERPYPKDNEVLVRIYATTVTVGDSRIRGFRVPPSFWIPARIALGFKKPKKSILGSIFAGEIELVGKEVKLFKKGDKVFGTAGHNFGSYAEYICTPENGCLGLKPTILNYEEAAAIPWGGLTALYFLKKANIQGGQKVLIYGASGSVGASAVQIAKYFGAEVSGVCSTSNLDLVKSLGAIKVIDYTQENFSKNSEIYDIIFDTVGKSSIPDCLKSLNNDGIYLHCVVTPVLNIRMKITSILTGKIVLGGTFTPKTEDLIYLKELVEKGGLKPVIDRRYSLDQIVEAHRYVDLGHKKGDVIITI
jgi:NADPH:quinone reductase-like Zn-dependent oxidoreductase